MRLQNEATTKSKQLTEVIIYDIITAASNIFTSVCLRGQVFQNLFVTTNSCHLLNSIVHYKELTIRAGKKI